MCAWKPTTCQALCGALDGSLRTGTLILVLKRAVGASSSTGSLCDTSLLPRLQNPANHLVEKYCRSGFCLKYMWVPCTLKALLIFCVGVKWIFISWSENNKTGECYLFNLRAKTGSKGFYNCLKPRTLRHQLLPSKNYLALVNEFKDFPAVAKKKKIVASSIGNIHRQQLLRFKVKDEKSNITMGFRVREQDLRTIMKTVQAYKTKKGKRNLGSCLWNSIQM